ncbi:MAG TPA: MerC domain-containing protein [Puia sp.]|jgi:hypothetical protein|nr:MerC domain-containing protein [Puia sp.]
MSNHSHSSIQSKLDAIGISASLICAVHCVVLPFFLSSLPFLGIELLRNIVVESVIIGISLLVGSWALLTGYRKRHRQFWPVLLFAAGMLVLMGDTILVKTEAVDMAGKTLAAACIITAHTFNWKYSKAAAKQGKSHGLKLRPV